MNINLNIENEYASLKSVVVCWGENIPLYKDYKTDDPEFLKYHPYSWDKDLLLKQQEVFFKLLEKYHVKLIFPETGKELLWQIYTRDTAFVIKNKLYYSNLRKLKARNGEVEKLLKVLDMSQDQLVPIQAEIEGGDVLVVDKNLVYVGNGSRTNIEAINELEKNTQVQVFKLGDNVMHLDTRLTLLPKNIILLNKTPFEKDSLDFLYKTYNVIEISDEEVKKLGTNVFVINPETLVISKDHQRIGKEIENKGIKVEFIDYTEPINLGGSFRCTTLPTERE